MADEVVQTSPIDSPPPQPLVQQPRWRRWLWPDWEHRKKAMYQQSWGMVLLVSALLVTAYLWPLDPEMESDAAVAIWLALFLTRVLQYHLGWLVLTIGLVALWKRRKYLAVAATPAALFCLGPAAWSYVPRGAPVAVIPSIRIVSANLLMINEDTQGIIDEIKSHQPDVILLQEYTHHWHDAFQKNLGATYPYCSYEAHDKDDSFGIAIYSRVPFVGDVDKKVPLGFYQVPQMRAVVQVGDRKLAIYNVHLMPPRRLDYTREHLREFNDLLRLAKEDSLPVIISGDFNFTETTPQAKLLADSGYRDAHDVAGYGHGATWPVNSFLRYVPGVRLDHVYLGRGVTCTRLETGIGRGSDHRPLIADIALLSPQ